MKKEFILGEIWLLTINAAFQRANIYKLDCSNKEKEPFKEELNKLLIKKSKEYNNRLISEEEHIQNIYSISSFSADYPNVLREGRLNFGISQKLLNLYLKYLWCLDLIKYTPPHFPVDRIIQTKLRITKPYSWTAMVDEKEYLNVIEIARKTLPKYEVDNLAELELKLFERNSSTKK